MPLTSDMACGHPMYQDDHGRCICPKCLRPGMQEAFAQFALGDQVMAAAAPSAPEDDPACPPEATS